MSKVLFISLCLQAQSYYCVMNENVFLSLLIDKADVYYQIYDEYIIKRRVPNLKVQRPNRLM